MSLRKKIKNMSISFKLTVWYTVFISIILIVFITFSTKSIFYIMQASNERELMEKVTELSHKINKNDLNILDDVSSGKNNIDENEKNTEDKRKDEDKAKNKDNIQNMQMEYFKEGIYFSYFKDGKILKGVYPDNFVISSELSDKNVRILTINGEKFMYYDSKIKKKGSNLWIRGVLPISKSINSIRNIIIVIVSFSIIFILIVCIGGYKIIKNSLKPINKLSHTAYQIEKSKDFSRRLYVSENKDELYDMSIVLNSMLSSLERAFNREKQFSNDVSHELRTPISVIISESEYAKKHIDNIDDARKSFDVIFRQSSKISSMVKNILLLSRMENFNDIEMEEIELSNILKDIICDYKILFDLKSKHIYSCIEEDVSIIANREMFERVIDNLLSNAIKFSRNKVYVKMYTEENFIKINVKDDGCGIDKDNKFFIWDRFYQIEESRNKDENSGIGLGLSFVKTISKLHGWQVDVYSEFDKGSEFIVSIPI